MRLREPCRCGPEVQAGARFHAADAAARGSQAVHRLPGNGSSSAEARADSACGPEAIDGKLRRRAWQAAFIGRVAAANRRAGDAGKGAGPDPRRGSVPGMSSARGPTAWAAPRARRRHDAGQGQNRDEEPGPQCAAILLPGPNGFASVARMAAGTLSGVDAGREKAADRAIRRGKTGGARRQSRTSGAENRKQQVDFRPPWAAARRIPREFLEKR